MLTGQDLYMLQIAHMVSDVTGRITAIQKLKLVHTQHVRMSDKVI